MTMLNLSGYQDANPIYSGTRTLVYRAIRSLDCRPVIIKVLRNLHPSFDELVQFRNQYLIARQLEHPTIVQPLALERYNHSYALVMPDDGAIVLSDYWPQSSHSLSELLAIAVQLAEALHYLSQQHIIHKDIKPKNILLHPETQQVKLIDFSLSSLLPKEEQQLIAPNVLEGTLPYVSPEQTGRMNRRIDYRTDFYSLGVTFFELLTGQLPFETDDPMELVHCHIAQAVKFPENREQEARNRSQAIREAIFSRLMMNEEQGTGNREQGAGNREHLVVPERVQAIVLKLMAKNAEDRYQSALGLKYDLEKCLSQWQETGEIVAFDLAQRDVSDRFLIPEKLYGREASVQVLLNAFDRVAAGSSELMLVVGFSGIGKTAVVNEVHKPITQQRGYFIKGKFDQFNRNIPFSAFVQAFRSLMGQLLSGSDVELANWRANILDAVGENGQVLIEMIPELEYIIGEQPAVPELLGNAAQNRFNLLFGKFVQIFTTKEHPLVIFLDDLQWADSASLNLLKLLMDNSETGYLLVLGAYRDNEVFTAHPLTLTLDEIKRQGANLHTLTLFPLREKDITRLVAETLQCPTEIAVPLSELIYQNTQGNPFFTLQFLKGLHQDGCIRFEIESGYWQYDLAQTQQLTLIDQVVEFIVERLRKLPETTQAVLQFAACIGNQFDLAMLAVVCENAQDKVAAELWIALQAGMVIPESETYKFFQGEQSDAKHLDRISVSYRFMHDRVQQAAYSLIPNNQKAVTHFKVGKLLLEKIPLHYQESRVFEVVSQLNVGIELYGNSNEYSECLRLNCIAGKRAKEATAYEASTSYFEMAKSLLPTDHWCLLYDKTIEIYFNLAEVRYLAGNFKSSESLIETISQFAKTPIERSEACNLLIIQYTIQGKFQKALESGQKALSFLDFDLSEHDMEEKILLCKEEVDRALSGRRAEQLLNEPESGILEKRITVKILNNLLVPTYVLQKQDLYFVITLSMVFLSLSYGVTAESGYGFSSYGMFLGARYGDYQSGYEFGVLAVNLAKRFNQANYLCRACYILGNNLLPWVQPLRYSEPIFNEGFLAGLESGELIFAGNILMYKVLNPFFAGQNIHRIQQNVPEYLNIVSKKIKYQLAFDVILGLNVWLSNITSNIIGDNQTEDEYLAQCTTNNSTYAICHYWILKTKILCLYGRYAESFQASQNAEAILNVILGKYQVAALNFYQSIALIGLCFDAESDVMKLYLDKVRSNREKLEIWAASCSENFTHKCYLVDAELANLFGNREMAIDLYDRAIDGAKENHYVQEEALANELAAKFYFDWGKEKIAALYMQAAYYCYCHWGATAKTNDLENCYPTLLQPILQKEAPTLNLAEALATLSTPTTPGQSSTKNITSSSNTSTALDFVAVLRASQSLSGTIQLNELLHQLSQIILQNSGGDRCALILPDRDERWRVYAIATPETTELCSEPLEGNPNLPVQLIQYVKNTQDVVMVEDLNTDLPIVDDYLAQKRPKSVLCLPILNQGNLIGTLYLRNQSTRGVFTSDRILVLNFLCTQAAISLENARLYQDLEDYSQTLEERVMLRTEELAAANADLACANEQISTLNEQLKVENLRMSAELDVVRDMQQMVLPNPDELKAIEGLDIAAYMAPADEVGGDYYDVLDCDGIVTLGIGDVTGHGLESGILMIMTQTAVRTLQEMRGRDPVRFLDTLNRTLYKNVQRMNTDKSLTLAILNYENNTLSISGQHEETIVVRADGEVERIDTMDLGLPIGLDDDIAAFIDRTIVRLNAGDGVVLYTDGITEARNMKKEQYGLERLCEVASGNWQYAAEEIKRAVIDDVRKHIGEQTVFDDITLLVLKQQ